MEKKENRILYPFVIITTFFLLALLLVTRVFLTAAFKDENLIGILEKIVPCGVGVLLLVTYGDKKIFRYSTESFLKQLKHQFPLYILAVAAVIFYIVYIVLQMKSGSNSLPVIPSLGGYISCIVNAFVSGLALCLLFVAYEYGALEDHSPKGKLHPLIPTLILALVYSCSVFLFNPDHLAYNLIAVCSETILLFYLCSEYSLSHDYYGVSFGYAVAWLGLNLGQLFLFHDLSMNVIGYLLLVIAYAPFVVLGIFNFRKSIASEAE